MKKILFLYHVLMVSTIAMSQNWTQKSSLPATLGCYPYCFSIGGKLYVGGGFNAGYKYDSFYVYNPTTDTWTVRANIPNHLYGGAFFVLNGKGYIACGNSNNGLTNGVYLYDPILDTWTQKNNFPGFNRQNTIGFSLNNKGYLFCGFTGVNTVVGDMWEYDPALDSWTQKANSPVTTRNGPTAIVINNKAYVGLGSDVSGSTCYTDFYRFDPIANTYTQVANIPVGLAAPAHFCIDSTGYIGLGYVNSTLVSDQLFKFDPYSNSWAALTNFSGPSRAWCISDTVNGKPYIGTGADLNNNIFLSDLWTWPDSCRGALSLGADTAICGNSGFILTDTMSGVSHFWSTGDTSASITIQASGIYWLLDSHDRCLWHDTIRVTFSPPPPAFSLGNDTIYCGSFSRILNTGDTGTLWSTGVRGASITVTTPGLYWAEISNGCGSLRDSILISHNAGPPVSLGNDTTLCTSGTFVLRDTASGLSFLWSTGAVSDSISVSTTGSYWLRVTQGVCINSDTIKVTYDSIPAPFYIGSDTTYCGSFMRTLTTSDPNTLWSTSVRASSILVTSPALYWAEKSNACGVRRDSMVISQNTAPPVNLGNDTIICSGNLLTLNATSVNATYRWQDNSTAPTFTATSAGIYWVEVTLNNCTKRDSIVIANMSSPQPFSLAQSTTLCSDSTLVLNAYQPSVSYHWSNGDTLADITVSRSGTYNVTVSNACGSASASETISVISCTCKLVIPTAFSPNGDDRNDLFTALTQCPITHFEMNIYNRWGEKIFSSNSIAEKWDGTYRGYPQPTGVYVYYVKYSDAYTDKETYLSGNVTLFR